MAKVFANKVVDLFPTIKNSKNKYVEIPDMVSFSLPEVTFADGELTGAGIYGTINKPDIYSIDAMELALVVKSLNSTVRSALTPDGVEVRLNYAVDNVNGSGTETYTSYSAVVKGYPKNIPAAEVKKGEGQELTINIAVRYYKLSINGKVVFEIDPLNGKMTINGKDYAKKLNKALNK